MIIGITGTLGAGKTTAANYLKSKGFTHYSVRAFIAQEVEKRGLPINRDTLVGIGNELRAEHGPAHIVAELCKRAHCEEGNSVIESVRAVGEADELREHGGHILAINANSRLRYDRARLESGATVPQSYEEFIRQEEREMHSDDPTKQNIAAVMLRADYQVLNNGTIPELERQIDAFLANLDTTSA